MKFKIHTWPDKLLKTPCKEVKEVNQEIRKTLDGMYSYMRISDGVGLAANQVGLTLKLIVIEWADRVLKLVNPTIIKKEGSLESLEGCLSFPGVELSIKRSKKVSVDALDREGKRLKIRAEGILAVILQHEIDHLSGITLIDRVSLLKRALVVPKLNAIKKKKI